VRAAGDGPSSLLGNLTFGGSAILSRAVLVSFQIAPSPFTAQAAEIRRCVPR